jgi:hypothetical protein
VSERLPEESLRLFLAQEKRLWESARALIDRVKKFIVHNLPESEYVSELTHVRQALKALTDLNRLEDAAAIAGGFVTLHEHIQKMGGETRVVQEMLEHVIKSPSEVSLERLEAALNNYAAQENQKLRAFKT